MIFFSLENRIGISHLTLGQFLEDKKEIKKKKKKKKLMNDVNFAENDEKEL